MAKTKNNENNINYPKDKASRTIYLLGGIASFIIFVYCIVTLAILALIPEGMPKNALECFNMLNDDFFIGLIRLDIISVVVIPLYYIIFYSLYLALKNGSEQSALISLFCILAGVTIFLSDINIYSIVHLSDKYWASGSEEYRQHLLSACEGMLVSDIWSSTSSIIRNIIIELGALMLSVIMLKTRLFNRFTAIVGILTHSLDITHTVLGLFIPEAGEAILAISGTLYIIWYPLIGYRLVTLSKK